MNTTQWYLISSEQEYESAMSRFQSIKSAEKGSAEHKEKMLLARLIQDYEQNLLKQNLPELDPIELIKVRMEDFGYKSADLARIYGDRSTISKVLHYKQALSLTMIRKFSELLRLPVESLIKEYELKA